MAPVKPLRLQVIDRIIVVLQAIVEGDSFWKTTGQVARRWIAPNEAIAFPVYGVHASDGQAPEEDAGEYREEFAVVVEGVVKSATDTVTEMEHALADVRRAVDTDSRDGATAGALGTLTVYVRVGRSWTDEGENVASGLGYFWQEFLVQIAGDPFGA
ncbi:MAG: hypothetical protein ABFD52_08840 [Acidobacteriota bacterium]